MVDHRSSSVRGLYLDDFADSALEAKRERTLRFIADGVPRTRALSGPVQGQKVSSWFKARRLEEPSETMKTICPWASCTRRIRRISRVRRFSKFRKLVEVLYGDLPGLRDRGDATRHHSWCEILFPPGRPAGYRKLQGRSSGMRQISIESARRDGAGARTGVDPRHS
jgi:hypothetical protein